MKRLRAVLLFGSALAAAACVPRQEPPPPAPQPQPPATRPASPRPAPPPPRTNWQDLPLSPGNWSYRQDGQGSTASFGAANGEGQIALRCDLARRQIMLSRQGAAPGSMMTVRTSTSARTFPMSSAGQTPVAVHASIAPGDRFLDAIAFSRGRFTVEVPGTTMLVIPSWPEPARVVEDCRG